MRRARQAGEERPPLQRPGVAGHETQFQLTALGSLLDGRRDQADILRQVAKGSDGCHELRSGREAERVWVK